MSNTVRARRNGKSVLPSKMPKGTPTIVAKNVTHKDKRTLWPISTHCCLPDSQSAW